MIDRDELINSWEIFRDKMISALTGKGKQIMLDREKVIKKLAVRIQSDSEKWNTVELPIEEAKDILALLKEQEPRVLTPDELYLMEHKCVYLERRNSKVYSTEPSIVIGTSKFLEQYRYLLMRENKICDVRYSSDYNKETKSGWRCWSAKQTEERRREVKWDVRILQRMEQR